MTIQVKVCGLKTAEAVEASARPVADMIGFVFYGPSPRAVTPDQAGALAAVAAAGVTKVGLFVDADDALIDAALEAARLDMLQLHGSEQPERIAEIKARTGRQVIKAIKVGLAEDLDAAARYQDSADLLLFDAKPTMADALPGGNGIPFEWSLLRGRRWARPWMLSGGLTPDNVAEALRISAAAAVDVSSGVERAPGDKDPDAIAAFLAAVRAS